MKLTGKEPWMRIAGQLNHLDKPFIRRPAAEQQAGLFQSFAILGIEFIAMTVSLADLFRTTVNFTSKRACGEFAGPGAESHRASQLLNIHQVSQFEDHRVRRVRIKLRRVCVLYSANVSRKFQTCRLHAETNTEIRC